MKLLIYFIKFVQLSSLITAKRVSEWYGSGDDSYTGGSARTDYTPMLGGVLLGICVQRIIEKNGY